MRIRINGVLLEVGQDLRGWWRIDIGQYTVRQPGDLLSAVTEAARLHGEQCAAAQV